MFGPEGRRASIVPGTRDFVGSAALVPERSAPLRIVREGVEDVPDAVAVAILLGATAAVEQLPVDGEEGVVQAGRELVGGGRELAHEDAGGQVGRDDDRGGGQQDGLPVDESLEIRRVIYTTNAVEALNRQLRKVVKTRGAFPSDKAVFKLLWLAIGRLSAKWTYPRQGWDLAMQQFAIHFEGRVSLEDYAARRS